MIGQFDLRCAPFRLLLEGRFIHKADAQRVGFEPVFIRLSAKGQTPIKRHMGHGFA